MSTKTYNEQRQIIFEMLSEVVNRDRNVVVFFVHGSFVNGTTSNYAFRDERYFRKGKYLYSKLIRTDASVDVDCFMVSKDPEKSAKRLVIDEAILDGLYITINIISPDTFFEEISAKGSRALKRILLFKEIEIFIGSGIVSKAKASLSRLPNSEVAENKNYQDEFQIRKNFFRFLGENNINEIKIDRSFFDELCPTYTKFVAGEIGTGFPQARYKLVFPKSMGLKAKIDLDTLSITELE
ncbi:MAG: hypothetical protein ACD_61C00007G0010 [uncultured bacterium]|nr:MAG: hypothetical protein ACD_61C00007G0010 [uncultured bacterium]